MADVRLSIRKLVRDVLEDQFSLNAALPRTMRGLFLKPGFLTREYFDLRIARYVPPFRLYLISSLLFFLFASFLTARTPVEMKQAQMDSVRAEVRRELAAEVARESARRQRITAGKPKRGIFLDVTGDSAELANWAETVEVNLGNERLNRIVKAKLLELGDLPPAVAFRRLMVETVQQVPKVMFLLLPIFALLLKLLYVRQKRLYVEHFVFALHLHSFMFLLFFVMLMFRKVELLTAALMLWVPFYTLLAMKRVYLQGWFITTVKWGTLGLTYLTVLSFGLVLALVTAILTV